MCWGNGYVTIVCNYERQLFSIKELFFFYSQPHKRSNLDLKKSHKPHLYYNVLLQFSEQVETMWIFLKSAEVFLSKNLVNQQTSS